MAAGTVTTAASIPYHTFPVSAAVPINFTATTTDLSLFTKNVTAGTSYAAKYLLGWVISESTGSAAASFQIYDNTVAAGPHAGIVSLVQGTTSSVWFGTNSVVMFSGSLFLHIVSGSVQGAVFYVGG